LPTQVTQVIEISLLQLQSVCLSAARVFLICVRASRAQGGGARWAEILPPKYEEDTITHDWVMAHFSCIHYVPVWPWSLTIFPKLGHVTRRSCWMYMPIWKFIDLCII